MPSARTLVEQLRETAATLQGALASTSAARDEAQELHDVLEGMGVRFEPQVLAEVCARIDDAARQIAAVEEILSGCADDVERDIVGTGQPKWRTPRDAESTEPTSAPAPTDSRAPAGRRRFAYPLIRLIAACSIAVVALAGAVLELLHLRWIFNGLWSLLYIPGLIGWGVGLLLDPDMPPRPRTFVTLLVVAAAGVAFQSISYAAGWRGANGGTAAASIVVLAAWAAMTAVAMRRRRARASG